MKVKPHGGGEERAILVGMITDATVAGKIAAKWNNDGMFRSRWADLIGRWCCGYFQKYQKAPGSSIESIFRSWAAAANRDEDTVKLVDRFLSSLSDEYEELATQQNAEYVVDLAGRHFQTVSLERLAENIRGDLELNELDKALAKVTNYSKVDLGTGAGINVLEDEEAIRAVFEEQSESLIEWPGDLAKFFGNAFERDAFLAYLAPEKRGKTMMMIDAAWRAMVQKRRVAFFEVGDMSEKQIMRRFMVRASKMPFTPQTVKRPIKISKDEESGEIKVEHEEVEFDEALSWNKAMRACERITKGRTSPYLKLSVHPNSSVSVDGIRAILQDWEREGWIPDIVVIDYADNLDPPPGQHNDVRHSINMVWKQLRRLSQELHCCLITATQADAASYDKSIIGKSNFSEDKRKLAHVTGMIGINQIPEEQKLGVFRLNWIVRREAEFSEYRCINVASCLVLSRPIVLTLF